MAPTTHHDDDLATQINSSSYKYCRKEMNSEDFRLLSAQEEEEPPVLYWTLLIGAISGMLLLLVNNLKRIINNYFLYQFKETVSFSFIILIDRNGFEESIGAEIYGEKI